HAARSSLRSGWSGARSDRITLVPTYALSEEAQAAWPRAQPSIESTIGPADLGGCYVERVEGNDSGLRRDTRPVRDHDPQWHDGSDGSDQHHSSAHELRRPHYTCRVDGPFHRRRSGLGSALRRL